jgi:hypothetical protein
MTSITSVFDASCGTLCSVEEAEFFLDAELIDCMSLVNAAICMLAALSIAPAGKMSKSSYLTMLCSDSVDGDS